MTEINSLMFTNSLLAPISSVVAKKIPNPKFYAHHRNNWLNGIVIAYIFGGYGLSLFCITANNGWLNLLGVVLLTHTLTWAAFFVHEFFHQNIFAHSRLNLVFGEAMLFITGSCYSPFGDLASHHLAHHIYRADFSPFYPFSMIDFLQSLPKLLLKIIVVLEWLCIPIVNLMFRWMIILSPFLSKNRKNERFSQVLLIILRGGLITALALYSPRSLIFYFIGYIGFLHTLQFIEGFQHTYSAFQIKGEVPKQTLEYEETNSYSLVLRPWLSVLLCLNNNYHNAHHRLMSCPWYLLPRLDAELYPRNYVQYVPLLKLLKNYFRYRLYRLFQGQGIVARNEHGLILDNFAGATGMSFMILRKPFDWVQLS
ncbi:fatty acid desaturase family protein [Gloeothece verrucosa]|uniref:Fatty acid desaturase n=1 Tax=Gloeothece verrucosa (strain PCC 7822) TaxID=497965 RepID=E0ULP2_GLOV7|nr:fatty acid desaturase [Gloeothece verrucosa]ADN17872.1 fatty acid desaturase [Gloeothece verrucosa PCC 7822]